MNLFDLFRTTTVRWSLAIAAALVAQSCLIALLVYLATVSHRMAEIDESLANGCTVLSRLAPGDLLEEVGEKVERDVHRINLIGLFAKNGNAIAGNIETLPPALVTVPGPLTIGLVRTQPYDPAPNQSRAVACATPRGDRLVLARDTDDIDALRALFAHALLLAVLPTLFVAVLLGLLLGRRGQTRFRLVRQAIDKVMSGDLKRRLPQARSNDPFDMLVRAVNEMLDRLEEAIDDVRALGDDIAHAVRTPLTRLRARLERSLDTATDEATRFEIASLAIGDVDHALGIVSAILRIRTIDSAKRGSRFASTDVSTLLEDAAELYRPIAETKNIALDVEQRGPALVVADRDLLMEAICSLIDNAIKFTPPGGRVHCRVGAESDRATIIEIADTGPGIPAFERKAVVERFRRGTDHALVEGYGIGLSLVAAILKLHGFKMRIEDASPGCLVAIDLQ